MQLAIKLTQGAGSINGLFLLPASRQEEINKKRKKKC